MANMADTVAASKEETVTKQTNSPLVFISHDSRDAELAEEFSKLLKSASSGALKSFRSSDKKGTQGIEYGLDWYPAIMDKIDEATDVVCLLTQRSVERPWILYEAGVAKGKLNKKVIGVAIGIQHSVAFTGPFAQFQNNDGSVEAISKLVLDLVRKMPNLDPDPEDIKRLVHNFHAKATEIAAKNQPTTEQSAQAVNDDLVPKLFEEVKIMFEKLPSRIENSLEPDSKRRRRRFHPGMFEDWFHMGLGLKDPSLAFLLMLSMYKEDFPWLFEVGLETYRGMKSARNIADKKKLLNSVEQALDMLGHPMFREMYGKSEEMHFLLREGRHIMQDYIHRMQAESDHKSENN
jgi:hypothetical protein